MKDITQNFGTLYHPQSALVFYSRKGSRCDTYVEHFDMDKNGMPINAHPLTIKEAKVLVKALKITDENKEPILKCDGMLGNHILHLDPKKGKAIWFTKGMQRKLYFDEKLGILNGKANTPPLLWMASRNSLFVFALASNHRPTERTKLYHAPFFNVYENGNVCMGNVDVRIKKTASIEEFTTAWETYFFNSYFIHLMENHNPVVGNCVSIWESLINTEIPFPKKALKRNKLTLKNLL